MLLGRQALTLCSELGQTAADAETSIARFDDIVDVTILCSLVWSSEQVVILIFLFCKECLYIFSGIFLCLCLFFAKHSHGTGCTHNCNFG